MLHKAIKPISVLEVMVVVLVLVVEVGGMMYELQAPTCQLQGLSSRSCFP